MEAVATPTVYHWTPEQDNALVRVATWLREKSKPFFYLAGFAGTGKTTLAKYLAQDVGGDVLFGAFTGKAAYVLQNKGCPNATTIHKLLYQPKEKSKARLRELEEKMDVLVKALTEKKLTEQQIKEHDDVKKLQHEIDCEHSSLKRPLFGINEESPIKDATLLVIDECSMVDARMADDLLSFNVPILVLGDPFQLPPVGGEGFFTRGKPDMLLTDIQRQAKDNPILRLAHDVREGRGLKYGQYGESKVICRDQISTADVLAHDQVLVGTNKSRRNYNFRQRQLRGFTDVMPMAGEKLICLRNNGESGLLNGSMWRVSTTIQLDEDSVELDMNAIDGDGVIVTTAHSQYFKGEEPKYWEIREKDCFDYGYNITVHKSQGSQWDGVYLFDESRCFRQDAAKWLYTGITRAAQRVTVVM